MVCMYSCDLILITADLQLHHHMSFIYSLMRPIIKSSNSKGSGTPVEIIISAPYWDYR